MNLTVVLAALVAVGVLTAGGYYQGRQDGEAKIEAQQAREREVAAAAAESAASAAAAAIARIRVTNTTIQNEVQREVSERVVYRDCQHSPEQLQRLNAALTGERPEPADRGSVPGADATGGFQLRGDDDQTR